MNPPKVILLGLAACIPLCCQVNATFSFEDSMEGWEPDLAVPQITCHVRSDLYPECPSQPSALVDVMAAIRRTKDRAADGTHSLKFTIDGTLDEGTAWIIRPFTVAPGMRYQVTLQWYLTAVPENSIGYVGAVRPRGMPVAPGPPTTDFLPVPCGVSDQPGWLQCGYITEVSVDAGGTIWAALGAWANYESVETSYIDKVTVTINPVAGQTTTAALGMVPESVSGIPQNPLFTFVFNDTKGWQDLGVVNILINDSLSPYNACYLAYVPDSLSLFLVNDAGTDLLSGTKAFNNPVPLVNSQCTVQLIGLQYSADNQTLSLQLNIKTGPTFSGTRNFFLAARDINESNNTGWQKAGTWVLP